MQNNQTRHNRLISEEKTDHSRENNTTPYTYIDPTFMNVHVGGDLNHTNNLPGYLEDQSTLINQSISQKPDTDPLTELYKNIGAAPQLKDKFFLNQGVPVTEPLQRNLNQTLYIDGKDNNRSTSEASVPVPVDPYYNFLRDHGLLYDGFNKRRYKTIYLNINSAFRRKEPCVKLEEFVTLSKDPIYFKKNSSHMFIKHSDHGCEEGDLIMITSVSGKNVVLRTFDDKNNPAFEILPGCNIMKIFYPHDLPESYNDCALSVEIKGIKGDNNKIFLGNVPINLINGKHKIKVKLTEDDIHPDCNILDPSYLNYDPNHFFIVLPKKMHSVNPPYDLREYNFKLSLLYVSGMPLDQLNAKYPIDKHHKHGHHMIKQVTDDGYHIDMHHKALKTMKGGGFNVTVCKIIDIECGYPCPNNYKIDLGRTFNNIVSTRLISSEIPNVDKVIKDCPLECANNKIYWNVLDKGNTTYHLKIDPGNYTMTELVKRIECEFNKDPQMHMEIDVDTYTDKVTFKCFKKTVLCQPIIAIEPEVDTNLGVTNIGIYKLQIKHPKHGILYAGVKIHVLGSTSYLGIPEDIINTKHIITKIIDDDTYEIELPKFNPTTTILKTNGGATVTIMVPDMFRLRFDKHDTMGKILGFKDPCHPTSVTPYKTKISNWDDYDYGICKKSKNCSKSCSKHNVPQLREGEYMLMIAEPLYTLDSVGPVKRAYAKILYGTQLNLPEDLTGNTLFNTFVRTSKFYEDPLNELSELTISFVNQNGDLIDFGNRDHSFTLEIVTVNDIPEGAGITANTGQNYNIRV